MALVRTELIIVVLVVFLAMGVGIVSVSAQEPVNVVIVSDTSTQWLSSSGWQGVTLCYVAPNWNHISGASWIWPYYLLDTPEKCGPYEFNRTISIPENAQDITATIQITADNEYALSVNGQSVGSDNIWESIETYPIQLNPGENVISIIAVNYLGGPTNPLDPILNPGGLQYRIDLSYIENQPPVFEIVDAKMISPNELGIGVNVTYPLESDSKKRIITFEAEINGIPIIKEIDVTGYTTPGTEWGKYSPYYPMFDSEGNLTLYTPLKIKLDSYNIPRFTDDIEFTLIGNASYEDCDLYTIDTFDVEIPLPVIILHGYVDIVPKEESGFPFDVIMKGYPGGKTSAPSSALTNPLIKYLPRSTAFTVAYKDLSDYLIQNRYYNKEKYWTGKTKKYVNLFDPEDPDIGYSSLSYATPNDIYKDMEKACNLAKEFSYADKINIVGHSTGGLAARYYASVTSGQKVNKVITVGTPNDGIARFYEQPFGHLTLLTLSGKKGFESITLEYSDKEDFIKQELTIPHSKVPNILTWFVPRWDAVDQSLYQVQVGDPNPYFGNNFNYNYDPSTRYYLIYGLYSDRGTPYSVPILMRTDHQWYDNAPTIMSQGDGYVYAQSAADLVHTEGQIGADITRKELIITYDHGVILKNTNVQEWILNYLEEKE